MLDSFYPAAVNSVVNKIALKRRTFVLMALLLAATVPLTACGKKPGQVDPPSGATETFPRVYPDPSTDPTP